MKASFAIRFLLGTLITLSIYSCKKADITISSIDTGQAETAVAAQTTTSEIYGNKDYVFTIDQPGWTLVFSDEFPGNAIDKSKWNVWTGGAYNEELQYYQIGNLKFLNGNLQIHAIKENATGATTPYNTAPKNFSFTSGRIESIKHFSSNATTPRVRMVARIKLASGYGMWPAFWSYGDPWPTQGEIDIMEAKGHEPNKYHTAYWFGRRSGVNTARNTEATISTVDLMSDHHVYEMIWEKDKLTFYLDGQLVNTKTGGDIPNMFRKSQRVTLNLAVGGMFFGTPMPTAEQIQTGVMEIDWVRVYTSK